MSTPLPKLSNNSNNKAADYLVHADHLDLRYGETEVFTDVCFQIERGAFASIVGPNGAGKTQLMRVMLNMVTPTAGYIERNFAMNEVGYVPQKIYIDPTFPITVREFLQTYVEPRGFWLQKPLPELDRAIAVDQWHNTLLGKLSGGQLQRVMLAAVLSTQARILFLDEFAAGIDPRGQAELFNYLHRLNERDGITIIMISHDIDITTQYADTALCLNKRMICQGKPHEVFTAENFQKMYGIPLTKLEHHDHQHNDHQLVDRVHTHHYD